MKILAIETSCDETAVAVLKASQNKVEVIGDALYSQIAVHAPYGGVFPNLAKREHQKNLVPLLLEALDEAKLSKQSKEEIPKSKINKINKVLEREPELQNQFSALFRIKKPKIDLITVTVGPGLEPALWVGINFAKALSILWDIKVRGVNHMEGHIVSSLWQSKGPSKFKIKKSTEVFPAISLLISGGHTEIVEVKDIGKYKLLGKTRDDAVGEAFDKVARVLSLPYPGGPEISKLASKWRERGEESNFTLPRPMIHTKDFDFSFSGLKTAVLYTVNKLESVDEKVKENIAKEFEDACIEVLISKTRRAVESSGAKSLIIGGGVSANKELRNQIKKLEKEFNIEVLLPEPKLATDNAIMIGIASYLSHKQNLKSPKLEAKGNLSLTM